MIASYQGQILRVNDKPAEYYPYPHRNLIARWNFEGNLKDDINKYYLVTAGEAGTTWSYSDDGKLGKGFLNGTNTKGTVVSTDSEIYSLGGGNPIMSISLWTKVTNVNADLQYLWSFYNIARGAQRYLAIGGASYNPPDTSLGSLFFVNSGSVQSVISNVDFRDNTWHHFVYKGDIVSNEIVYVDNVKYTLTPAETLETEVFYLNSAAGSWNVDGISDLLYIYNNSLTDAEVAQLYNNGNGI